MQKTHPVAVTVTLDIDTFTSLRDIADAAECGVTKTVRRIVEEHIAKLAKSSKTDTNGL